MKTNPPYGSEILLSGPSEGESFFLFAGGLGQFQSVQSTDGSLPTEYPVKLGDKVENFPVAYMWKDVLVPGHFYKHTTGQELPLSEPLLAEMATTVKQFLSNGNVIPILNKDHEEDRTIGFCIDSRMKEGRLELLHQFIGKEAALEALRNQVSVKIKNPHKDSKGNTYKYCIVHNSLTNDPVVTGQRQWSAIAASRGERSSDTPLFIFAASRRSIMDIAELRALLGLGAEVSDEEVKRLAKERINEQKTLKAENTTLSQRATTAEEKVKTLETELTTVKGENVTLSNKAAARKPTAQELYFAGQLIETKREKAISSGAITAAIAEKVEARYGVKDKVGSISLSMAIDETAAPLADGIAKTIEFYDNVTGNKPGPKEGESSANQHTTVPDTRNDQAKIDEANKEKDKDKNLPKNSREVVTGMMNRRYAAPGQKPEVAGAAK